MAEEQKGPSKNELKKAAKKAEKAAKKAAAKGQAAGGGAPAGDAAKQSPAPESTTVAPAPPPLPKLMICNASEGCAATLKAVWAALHYNVPLIPAKVKDTPKSLSNKPALLCGSDIVLGGGGNAMVKAISLMGGAPYSFEADDWCEKERTTRDAFDVKALAAALEASSCGVHLVGDCDTMADISVVTTLSKVDPSKQESWPPIVQTYYKAHLQALLAAKAAIPKYLPEPAVDLNDPSLMKVLTSIFLDAFEQVVPDADVPKTLVSKCANPKHGDYQCSGAMSAFASLKKSGRLPPNIKGPPQLANAIVAHLGSNHPVVSDLAIQGPGFIVWRISASYLQSQIQKIISTGSLPKPKLHESETCVVDFSSPNIAKEMHVGHLRSTIIGESACRILEFAGYKVERVNHVGDWGTQFGMLIQYLKEEYPDFAESMPNITDLTAFYKAAKQRFDDDADFKKTSQLNVVKLQSGDEECLKIWKILCDVSRKEFQKVYDRLDVTVFECGESFYNDKIPSAIDEFDKAKLLKVEEGGAKCVFVDGHKIPLMLQKSDGGYGYDSTDMAALKYRLHTLNAQRIIVITDFSQGNHFAMCNKAANDIGWVDKGQKLQHIGFGTVMGDDGKRFKTRSGDTVRLVDLLDEAVGRMETRLKGRIKENKANITEDEVHGVAEAIGYGAVKYFDLRRHPTSNYKFSYDDMLDDRGNTAVYLLYTRVRLESICAKAKAEYAVDVEELAKNGEQICIENPAEKNLALQINNFADVIEMTLDDLYPYHICEYVYDVAKAASDFVTRKECKVLGSPQMKSRLLLCYATTMVMHQCFDLLGIRHVKRI